MTACLSINTSNTNVSFMGYQQRGGSPRDSGRGRGIPRHEKAKVKKLKHHSQGLSTFEQRPTPTPKEIADRTLSALNHLGNQRFLLSPFSEQLNLWLASLKNVLSEFESNLGIVLDEQFVKERSEIVSNIELELSKRGIKEEHSEDNAKNLATSKALLEQINLESGIAMKTMQKRQETETKTLLIHIDDIKKELKRLTQMKTGIFRGISKETKAQKEAEARQRLALAQDELAAALQRFNDDQKKARAEYETRKQSISMQIQELEKEAQSQEIDNSLDARHAACEGLVIAVNSFLLRNRLSRP
jgi:hypothetical protein